jgi:hypothetical protein
MFRRLGIALILAGCGATDDAAAPDGPTWYGDVKPIVDSYCGDCHRAGGIAPMALATRDDLATWRGPVLADIESREMPPWEASPAQRYRFDDSLPDAQIDLLRRWYDAGAPEGDASAAAPPIVRDRSKLSRVDIAFRMPEAYTPAAGTDDYRCFPFPWPYDDDRFITGFAVAPGDAAEAHHAVAFLMRPEDADRVDALDAADPGPGYACYGAPYVGTPLLSQFLGAWAPGGGGLDFPAGTGIRVRPGARVVLQMHYNAHGQPPGPDQTELRFSLAAAVDQEAWLLPWFDLRWALQPASMKIPAGEAKVVHEFEGVPADANITKFVLPGVDLAHGFTLHTVAPHMHRHGLSEQIDVLRADGTQVPLLDVPRWDFDWQRTYVFAQPIHVAPGDRLRIRCTWDNTEATQSLEDGTAAPIRDLTWGEGSGDEMCASMMYMTRD